MLDEADRMLDMGFSEAIDELMAALPRQRQTLLYSATFPDAVRAVSRRFQHEPADVTVEEGESAELVTQHFHEVEPAQKTGALLQLLAENRPELALVFCNTRHGTVDLAAQLDEHGVSALALHGELDQREREETLVQFANRSIRCWWPPTSRRAASTSRTCPRWFPTNWPAIPTRTGTASVAPGAPARPDWPWRW